MQIEPCYNCRATDVLYVRRYREYEESCTSVIASISQSSHTPEYGVCAEAAPWYDVDIIRP